MVQNTRGRLRALRESLRLSQDEVELLLETQRLNQETSSLPLHLVLDSTIIDQRCFGLWFLSGDAVDVSGSEAVQSVRFDFQTPSPVKVLCMTILHAMLKTFRTTGSRSYVFHFHHKNPLWSAWHEACLEPIERLQQLSGWSKINEECFAVLTGFCRFHDLSFRVADMDSYSLPSLDWDDLDISPDVTLTSYTTDFLNYRTFVPPVWLRRPLVGLSDAVVVTHPRVFPPEIDILKVFHDCVSNHISQVQWLPQRLRHRFASLWFQVIGEVLDHPDQVDAWKKFVVFPLLILHNRSKATQGSIAHRLWLWDNNQYRELLDELAGEREVEVGHGSAEVNVKLASKYCKIGFYSKSNRIIQSDGLAEDSPETLSQLRALHPVGPPVSPDAFHSLPTVISDDDYNKVIWSCRNGLAVGPDGLHTELFKSCHYLVEGFPKRMTALINLVIANRVPEEIKPLLRSSKLVALRKGGGKVRPIGIGLSFSKIVAKCLNHKQADAFRKFFEPSFQFGVSTRGGIEKIICGIKHHWSQGKDTMISIDCRNAFNTVSRGAIADQVKLHFPSLWGFFNLFYTEPGHLFTSSGETLRSAAGVVQGCPLSPALFSLAIQVPLEKARSQFPDCLIYAYLDDILILGPSVAAGKCYQYLATLLQGIGLVVNPSKSKVYSSVAELGSEYEDLPREREGLILLGVPWGSDTFVTQHLDELLAQCDSQLKRLDILPSLQERWLLFSNCFSSKIGFWLRTVDPKFTESFSLRYDALLLNHFQKWLGVSTLGTAAMSQLTLPIAKGGLGFGHTSRIYKAAYLGGTALGLSSLNVNAGYLETCSWLESFRQIFRSFISLEVFEPMIEMIDLLDDHQIQSSLSDKLHEKQLLSLQSSLHGENRIRLDSIIASGSFWLRGRPGVVHYLMDNKMMLFSWKWRLGMPQFSSQTMGKRCHKCSNPLDVFGHHIQRCVPYQKYRSVRHTDFKDMWCYVFKMAGLRCRKEPQGLYPPPPPGKRKRTPDHLVPFFDLTMGKSLLTDVSVVWPSSEKVLATREKKKKDYYEPDLPRDATFVPLVCDVYGRWGSIVSTILNQCADHCYQNHRSFFDLKGSFQYYARTILDVLLQKILFGMYSSYLSHQVQSRDNTGLVAVIPRDFLGAGFHHTPVLAC
jgi:hypothetical protein